MKDKKPSQAPTTPKPPARTGEMMHLDSALRSAFRPDGNGGGQWDFDKILTRAAERRANMPHPGDVFPANLADAVTLKPDWGSEVLVGAQTAYGDKDCPCCGTLKKAYAGPRDVPREVRLDEKNWTDCPCVRLEALVERVTWLRLPLTLSDATWPNVDREGWPETREAQIRGWVSGWQPRAKGFLFHGDTGRGKTFIAALMAVGLASRGVRVNWISWPEMIADIRASFRNRNRGQGMSGIRAYYHERIKPYDAVFFDDIGEGDDSVAWAREVYEGILGQRAESFKTMVGTMNHAPDELSLMAGDRVSSRVFRVVRTAEIKGKDRRAIQKEVF